MRNKTTPLCSLLLLLSYFVSAQNIIVSGTVTSSDNKPLSNVSVGVKNTQEGTFTDSLGRFSLNADKSGVLIFSNIGFISRELPVKDVSLPLTVLLQKDAQSLGEVTVTAMGIKRQSKGLAYSPQTVAGSELTKVPQTNLMNTLSGKVAGITINSNASGVGGSVKVRLRGDKSIQGNNQPLYVIDGVPMSNNPVENITSSNTISDYGDGISNLNPNDIESITVLRGATSAALYGSQAANGAILITTKKAASGVSSINFSSGVTFDKAAYTPDLQTEYGQTVPGSDFSWGPKLATPAHNNVADFFQTGKTYNNSISLASGSDKSQLYLSYANSGGVGVIENNSLVKHNINIHSTSLYLKNKLHLDVNGNFIYQVMRNSPASGQALTPLFGLYLFPVGMDFSQYKNYEKYDSVRGLNVQNWWQTPTAYTQNPYWVLHKFDNVNKRNRVMLKISTQYDITSWMNIQVRGNVDRYNDVFSSKMYAGTAEALAGVNGSYSLNNSTTTEYYSDAILNFAKSFSKVKLTGLLGTSIADWNVQGQTVGSSRLYIANVFNVANMDITSPNFGVGNSASHVQLQAVFGNLNLAFDNWVYLDVTGRNDWSSSLSFTPNGSYFYPSFGLSALLHEKLRLPEFVSYLKLRGSYSVVGNSVPIYVTNPSNYIARGGGVIFNTTAPFNDLQPEKTKSTEFGTEMRFLNDKFSLDFTYYKTNTLNQFFTILVPPGTGYTQRYINGGNIQNAGIELTLGYTGTPAHNLKWNSVINFSINKNSVKELAPAVDQFILNGADLNSFFSILKVGGHYGDMYSSVWDRDSDGRIIIDSASGSPITKTGAPTYVGNANPKILAGWNNSFTYKNFMFSFLIDSRFGCKIMSVMQQGLDGFGVSKASAVARDKGGVEINGVMNDSRHTPVTEISAAKYYMGRAVGEYIYDGSLVKLSEINLGYSLPQKVLGKGFVKKAQFSVTGRNLFYFFRPAPTDSGITYSVGNAYSGLASFQLPTTRSFGFNLNLTF